MDDRLGLFMIGPHLVSPASDLEVSRRWLHTSVDHLLYIVVNALEQSDRLTIHTSEIILQLEVTW